jgi:hypothetical protein
MMDLGDITNIKTKELPDVFITHNKKRHSGIVNQIMLGKKMTKHFCPECDISWITTTK